MTSSADKRVLHVTILSNKIEMKHISEQIRKFNVIDRVSVQALQVNSNPNTIIYSYGRLQTILSWDN